MVPSYLAKSSQPPLGEAELRTYPRVNTGKTELILVDPKSPDGSVMERAASVIKSGGMVAFPTETVYGLGADAMNPQAVRGIFEAKGRPADNPLIVHISEPAMLASITAETLPEAQVLMKQFWPGPLTMVLKRAPAVTDLVSAGLDTIAVRMPRSHVATELIRLSATPIAAPSANLSGRPSPTRARDVWADLNGRIDLVLDGGPTSVGIESTVLDLTAQPPIILRPGSISKSELEAVIGVVRRPAGEEELRRSPGTRHRHYSPVARVLLVERETLEVIREICMRLRERGKVGFVGYSDLGISDLGIDDGSIQQILLGQNGQAYAASIYSAFRDLDADGVSTIVVQAPDDDQLSEAVMDRIRRAATETITGG